MAKYAKPKEEIINFLKNAPKASNNCYAVMLPLQSEKEAKSFIHRMRVELSRLREAIQNQGKQLRPFKMLVDKIENNDTKTLIILRWHNNDNNKVVEDVNKLFDILSTNVDTINEREMRGKSKRPLTI